MAQAQKMGAAGLRLLIINPNTNPAVSALVREIAERIVSATTEAVVINPEAGPFSIENEDQKAEAIPEVIRLIRESADEGFDAYALACFDDIGLQEARKIVDVPVVGTFEAGIAAARALGRRFSIVTTVHSAVPGIRALIERYEVRSICTVRAAGISVAAAADGGAKEDRLLRETIRLAIEEDGAEAILLGSGGLTGRAEELAAEFPVPIVDGVAAAVKMAESLACLIADQRADDDDDLIIHTF